MALDVIAIDQDALGKQATRVRDDGNQEVWARPLTPTAGRRWRC